MSKRSKEYKVRYYLVSFIDLLGQKEKIKALSSLPKNQEEEEEFNLILRNSYGKVRAFRNSFKRYFDSAYHERPLPPGLNESQIEEFKKIKEKAYVALH
ncbi:MAG: hypothetical protein EPN93_08280 [Spirochaetes bacterium]|nr:MAG: hypothetical protein EPN93_08280 [Spirochaetota bacterium]